MSTLSKLLATTGKVALALAGLAGLAIIHRLEALDQEERDFMDAHNGKKRRPVMGLMMGGYRWYTDDDLRRAGLDPAEYVPFVDVLESQDETAPKS